MKIVGKWCVSYIFCCLILSLFLFVDIVIAKGSVERIVEDFRPITSEATRLDATTFLLDRGRDVGIKEGDLFTLVEKGEPIFVPGTKKILGYQEKIVAKCKVTQVSKSSSTCKVYHSVTKPAPKLKAMRYSGIKAALFVDDKLVSPVFSRYSLKRMLPNMEWIEPSSGPMPVPSRSSMEAFGIDLVFQVKDEHLNVYGPGMKELSSYVVPEDTRVTVNSDTKTSSNAGESTVEGAPFHFDFAKAEVVGTLNGKAIQVAVQDIDGDGRKEVIYLTDSELGIGPFRRQGEVLFYKFDDFECPCSFSCYNGWLVLNVAVNNAGMASKLFRYNNGKLVLVQDEINLWLAFSPIHCLKKDKVLLGQEYEKERFRGQRIFMLRPTMQGIEYAEQAELPNDFSIQSVIAQKVNGVCSIFYVSFDGFLKVFAQGSHLWTSLYPVVEERACCGPVNADFVNIGNGFVFNGMVSAGHNRQMAGIYYFPFGDDYRIMRADVNLNGNPCGVSSSSKDIIIGVTAQEKETWKTNLYRFSLH